MSTTRNGMGTASQDRILDFSPMGMRWEITKSTADTGGQLFEAINVIGRDFAGPPLHMHPSAAESYAVVSGTLDVCVGGEWRKLAAGESVTVAAGTPHTLKNTSGAEVKLVNVHKPAQEFERFFRRLQALACSGRVTFPPKGLRSAILLSMLFSEHPQEVVSVKPPCWSMKALARVGRTLGYKLPPEAAVGQG
jgi:mannose-6-phosphate isomerase-like protein (cupin superfamily)